MKSRWTFNLLLFIAAVVPAIAIEHFFPNQGRSAGMIWANMVGYTQGVLNTKRVHGL